jgi:hypothetical protein
MEIRWVAWVTLLIALMLGGVLAPSAPPTDQSGEVTALHDGTPPPERPPR